MDQSVQETVPPVVPTTEANPSRYEQIVNQLSKGLATVNPEGKVIWANQIFRSWCPTDPINQPFFHALNISEEYHPRADKFKTAFEGTTHSFLISEPRRHLSITLTPIRSNNTIGEVAAICDDISEDVIRQQKLDALHRAGSELEAMEPELLVDLNIESRVDLLKNNLRQHIHNLLHYDVIEIRLLDPSTKKLIPLLQEGMTEEAAKRELYAEETGNGVTGYVAATGQSYLCPDASKDPRFLVGSLGARSSLTVPLKFHDEVIGTFNVESPMLNAFGVEDLQFTELFSREVARALHTLKLLTAQETCAATTAIETVNKETALIVDRLAATLATLKEQSQNEPTLGQLNSAVESFREFKQKLREITINIIQASGRPLDRKLLSLCILVVDPDERVLRSAHTILARLGCLVDSAITAQEGIALAKAMKYDVILSSVKHRDMGGTAAYRALKETLTSGGRILLTQGFEYDSGHTIVNARHAGYGFPVLFKPFQEKLLIQWLTAPEPPQRAPTNKV